MANKSLTYKVKLDLASAKAEAAKLTQVFQTELKRLNFGSEFAKATAQARTESAKFTAQAKADGAVRLQAAKAEAAAKIAASKAEAQERINASKAYAARGVESEKRFTSAVQTESQRRQQLAQLEARVIADAANVGRNRVIEQEKRTTALFKAELAERNRATRAAAQQAAAASRVPRTPVATTGVRTAGALLAGGAALITIQAVRQAAQYALAIGDARAQNLRAASSFQILAGSAKNADAELRAIRTAAGGTIDKLTAMQIATQATALKLADTAAEMGQLTRAAREITLVSATIGDAQTALTELSLFAANAKSFARADQLGLDVGSLKDRMKELQAADGSLDDSQAKLAASIQLLEERYGKLLDTEAAQASGAEQLRVAYADLKAEIAAGTVGDVINEGLVQLAGALNEARVALGGSTDQNAQQSALEQMIKNADWQNETFALGGDIGNKKGFEEVLAIQKQVNDSANDGVIGIENYRTSVANTIAEIVKWRVITDEQAASLRQIGVATATAVENNMFVAESSITAEQAAIAQREAVEGLAEQYLEMGGEIAAFANGLILSGANVKDFTERIEGMADFFDKKAAVKDSALSGASSLVKQFGVEEANKILEQQIAQIELTFQKFQRMGIRGGPLLDLGIADLENQLAAQVDGILAEADRLQELANLDGITSQLSQSLSNLNSGAFDGVEGIASIREELLGMASDVMFAAGATDEQAARFAYLSAVAYAAADSTSAFGQTQAALGVEFLNTNDYVGALASEMANLDGAYATGAISADYHRAALIQLVSAIYAAAQAAGAAAPQLASLLALKNALLASGPVNTPDAIRGTNAGRSIQQREALKAGMERREQLRDQQAAAAKEAAKGFKSAAGSAAKDFNAAAKSTKQAFENAAKTLESALRKVPGLFGASEVTQQQLDLAKAGGSVNMADDYLRRLRDEVKNGKDWADVSIEGAKTALERIGIAAGGSQEEILAQFEEAWSNSSLFADKANLDLINQDAVRQQLQIQDKIKQGQQNILDLFGATVDGVMAGVKAGDPTSIGLVAGELEGSDDKAIQEMAKGLRDKNQAMIDKVLALAVADPVEASGGGGGGSAGSGASLGIEDALPVFDPAEYGLTLNDAVTDWFAKAPPPVLPPAAFGPMPNPNALPAGQFGPTAMPSMAALGSAGAVAGPALTVDPTTTTNYMAALAAAFEAKAAEADAIGKTIGATIGGGMDTADLAAKATEYIKALDLAFDVVDKAYIGKTIGGQIGGGLDDADLATKASDYVTALSTKFGEKSTDFETLGYNQAEFIGFGFRDHGTATIASDYLTSITTNFGALIPNFTATGDIFAMFMKAGFNEHDISDMDDTYLNTVTTQFATLMPNMVAIGDTSATWVGQGFTDHDFSGLADGMIADLKAAFGSDATVASLVTLGGSLVSPIFQGFKNSVAFNPWLQTIVDEVVSQALDAQATATVDAQSATVVTGAGVQR